MTNAPADLKDIVDMKKNGASVEVEPAPCVAIIPCEQEGDPDREGLCLSVRYRICSGGGQVHILMKTYSKGHSPANADAASMSVIIANARLKRDYDMLRRNGIPCQRIFFALADVLPERGNRPASGFREYADVRDVVRMARLGEPVAGRVTIEYKPAGRRSEKGSSALIAAFTFQCNGRICFMNRRLGLLNENASPEDMRRLASEASEKLGRIIHTLMNAGVLIGRRGLSAEEIALYRDYSPVPDSWKKTLSAAGAMN